MLNASDRMWLDIHRRDPRLFTKIILDMDIDWDKLVIATEMLDLIEYAKFMRSLE